MNIFFAFVNSPWAALLLVAVIVLNSVFSVKLSTRSTAKIYDALSGLAPMNNLVNAQAAANGSDTYIFKLNRIIVADWETYMLRPKWVKSYEEVLQSQAIGKNLLNLAVKLVVFLFTAAKTWIGNDIASDKTSIFISHRLSSCKFCDEIAVFHKGCLVQLGSHDSLVADESGKYHELWNAQAQYYEN